MTKQEVLQRLQLLENELDTLERKVEQKAKNEAELLQAGIDHHLLKAGNQLERLEKKYRSRRINELSLQSEFVLAR